MPTKAEMYAQMAEQVAAKLTDSWQEYRVPYHGCPPLQVHVPGSNDDLCPEAGRYRLCRVRPLE